MNEVVSAIQIEGEDPKSHQEASKSGNFSIPKPKSPNIPWLDSSPPSVSEPTMTQIDRPASPRDTTPITVNGIVLNRKDIDTIRIPAKSPAPAPAEKKVPVISQKVLTTKTQAPYVPPSLMKASPPPIRRSSPLEPIELLAAHGASPVQAPAPTPTPAVPDPREQEIRRLSDELQRRELELQQKEEELKRKELETKTEAETETAQEAKDDSSDTLELDDSDIDSSESAEESAEESADTESSEEIFQPELPYARRGRQATAVSSTGKKVVYVRKKAIDTSAYIKIPETTPVLQSNPKRTPPNFKEMTELQKTDYRSYYRIQFSHLKNNYPKYDYPDFSDTVDLEIMDVVYHKYLDHIIRERNIYSSVSKYKIYFTVLLLILQVFGQKVLGFNLDGFTESQLKNMTEYDPLFIELGVKYQNPGGNSTPIEIRIMLVLLFNAVVFILINTITSFLGPQLGKQIYAMIHGALHSSSGAAPQAQSSPTHPGVQSVPAPAAASGGGFDVPSVLTNLVGLFGGGGAQAASKPAPGRAPRRPKYTE